MQEQTETETVTIEIPKGLIPKGYEIAGYVVDQYVHRPYLVLTENEMYLEGLKLTVRSCDSTQ